MWRSKHGGGKQYGKAGKKTWYSVFEDDDVCVSNAIPKCCLREISELNYLGENQRVNCTGCFERSSRSGIDIGGRDHVISLDVFLLVSASIKKKSFMSQSTVLVDWAETHFKSAEWAECFGNPQRKKMF